jgi:hypothetical protein
MFRGVLEQAYEQRASKPTIELSAFFAFRI